MPKKYNASLWINQFSVDDLSGLNTGALTGEQVAKQGNQREVQSRIRYAGVRGKDSENSSQCACNKQWLFVKSNGKSWHI